MSLLPSAGLWLQAGYWKPTGTRRRYWRSAAMMSSARRCSASPAGIVHATLAPAWYGPPIDQGLSHFIGPGACVIVGARPGVRSSSGFLGGLGGLDVWPYFSSTARRRRLGRGGLGREGVSALDLNAWAGGPRGEAGCAARPGMFFSGTVGRWWPVAGTPAPVLVHPCHLRHAPIVRCITNASRKTLRFHAGECNGRSFWPNRATACRFFDGGSFRYNRFWAFTCAFGKALTFDDVLLVPAYSQVLPGHLPRHALHAQHH